MVLMNCGLQFLSLSLGTILPSPKVRKSKTIAGAGGAGAGGASSSSISSESPTHSFT